MANIPQGTGAIRVYIGATPAAGVGPSLTMPLRTRWRLISVLTSLTTDATVPARHPVLTALSSGTAIWTAPLGNTIAASLAATIQWLTGYGQSLSISGTIIAGSMPTPTLLPAGGALLIDSSNLAAADQFSALTATVEEWIEP